MSQIACRALPPFDEDYHQETERTDHRLEERVFDRREVYERVLDEHQDS